jgi:hypothetical protein
VAAGCRCALAAQVSIQPMSASLMVVPAWRVAAAQGRAARCQVSSSSRTQATSVWLVSSGRPAPPTGALALPRREPPDQSHRLEWHGPGVRQRQPALRTVIGDDQADQTARRCRLRDASPLSRPSYGPRGSSGCRARHCRPSGAARRSGRSTSPRAAPTRLVRLCAVSIFSRRLGSTAINR